jgi:methionyl-tRNA formyltransferase
MYHYKNILVISDNDRLSGRFRDWIQSRTELQEVKLSFTKTIASVKKDETITEFVDLNKETDVEKIISGYDLVISLNCAQIFPEKLINGVKCINIHPGYNPDTRGIFSEVFALKYNTRIGATIHEMDLELDHGPVIARETVEKNDWDTAGSLYEKIIDKQFELIEKHFEEILKDTYTTFTVSEGKVYTKKDFQVLQRLDLNERKTTREFIDHLRALTFEGYDNCFFIDEEGRKVFVSIRLKPGEEA